MSQLEPGKLHVEYQSPDLHARVFSLPRRYTLTHSDTTGELFLTIGRDFNHTQIAGWYTRLMRDEVLAEWSEAEGGYQLDLYCHVSGGVVFGPAGWRFRIFRQHMPMVLQVFRNGDPEIYASNPRLDRAPVQVHFIARQKKYNQVEDWGEISSYRIPH